MEHTATINWLKQNTQIRDALLWAAQNPAETLRLIGATTTRTDKNVIHTGYAKNLGELIDQDPRAKDIFTTAVSRLKWDDKAAELRTMPLTRGRYTEDELARDIRIFQGTRDAQDRQRTAWRGTLAALGGKTFLDQIGAKRFESHHAEIRFQVPKGFARDGITAVKIDQNPADGFDIEFRAGEDLVVKKTGVKPDMLAVVFADVTGLRI
jgi:hypothetical protein